MANKYQYTYELWLDHQNIALFPQPMKEGYPEIGNEALTNAFSYMNLIEY